MTLQEYVDALRGKRVAVIGIGVSNTPLIDLLLDNGLPITVCDMRDETVMEDEAEILSTRGAEVRLGPGYLDGLSGFDVIFRTPGLLPTDPHLVSAREHGDDGAGSRLAVRAGDGYGAAGAQTEESLHLAGDNRAVLPG